MRRSTIDKRRLLATPIDLVAARTEHPARSNVGDERGCQIQVDAGEHRAAGLGVVRPAGAEAVRTRSPAAGDLGERGPLHEEEGLQRHGQAMPVAHEAAPGVLSRGQASRDPRRCRAILRDHRPGIEEAAGSRQCQCRRGHCG